MEPNLPLNAQNGARPSVPLLPLREKVARSAG